MSGDADRVEAAYLEAWRCGVHVTHDSIKRIIAAADACDEQVGWINDYGGIVNGIAYKSNDYPDGYKESWTPVYARPGASSEDVHREAAE